MRSHHLQSNSKEHLRRTIKRDRISLTESERQLAEARINALAVQVTQNVPKGNQRLLGAAVGLYAAAQGEVSLWESAASFTTDGVRVALPRVLNRTTMAFYETPVWTDLIPGAYGILEPPATAAVIGPADFTHIFVPGVAFSRDGGRIGYGGGYYDRYLASAPEHLVKVGVAFSFQMRDDLPILSHDIRMNYIVTEQGVYDCRTGTVLSF